MTVTYFEQDKMETEFDKLNKQTYFAHNGFVYVKTDAMTAKENTETEYNCICLDTGSLHSFKSEDSVKKVFLFKSEVDNHYRRTKIGFGA